MVLLGMIFFYFFSLDSSKNPKHTKSSTTMESIIIMLVPAGFHSEKFCFKFENALLNNNIVTYNFNLKVSIKIYKSVKKYRSRPLLPLRIRCF